MLIVLKCESLEKMNRMELQCDTSFIKNEADRITMGVITSINKITFSEVKAPIKKDKKRPF